FTAQPRDAFLVFGELLVAGIQFAVVGVGFAADGEQLPLQFQDAALARLLGNLQGGEGGGLGDHQQQDDRAETAAHHIEKGNAENVFTLPGRRSSVPRRWSPFSASAVHATGDHGQAPAGLRKEPPVATPSYQNSEAAIRAPASGAMLRFTGMPGGRARSE